MQLDADSTFWMTNTLRATQSRMKWSLMSICFVRAWNLGVVRQVDGALVILHQHERGVEKAGTRAYAL